jgi:hypothetical protein
MCHGGGSFRTPLLPVAAVVAIFYANKATQNAYNFSLKRPCTVVLCIGFLVSYLKMYVKKRSNARETIDKASPWYIRLLSSHPKPHQWFVHPR